MTDELEDRLRRHLAHRAEAVHAEPDASAFVDRSASRSRRPRRLAAGVAALSVLVGGAGVLAGVNLAGAGSAAPATSTTTLPGRAGAALAPAGAGASATPSIAFPGTYTLLFTRSTQSGVAVRAYTADSSTSGGCPDTGTVACTPVTGVPGTPVTTQPCATNEMCAEPVISPHATTGPVSAGGTTGSTGGSTGSTPSVVPTSCGQLVVELSTDRAVGSGSATLPTTAPTGDSLQVLATGTFGVAEGAPVSWVAVSVGSGVGSVQLTESGTAVDAMDPQDGVAVLAAPGTSGLVGASVVGLDPSGATVATIPAQPVALPDDAGSCDSTPVTPVTPPSTTTTTVPGTTTTVPGTTNTVSPPGIAVPGPNLPASVGRVSGSGRSGRSGS